jgi:hypothetical protein
MIVARLEEELSRIPIYAMLNRETPNSESIQNSVPREFLKTSSKVGYSQRENENRGVPGIIRVTFHDFPYVEDPAGMDCGSYEQLGELSAYVLRVFPNNVIKGEYGHGYWSYKKGEGIFADLKPTFLTRHEYYLVEGAGDLFEESKCKKVLECLGQGRCASIWVDCTHLPRYIDIPVPLGTYYIEYSLLFLKSNIYRSRKIHPNYPGRHASCVGLNDVCWGPPKVVVKQGYISSTDFLPSKNINFYNYPDPKEGGWQNSQATWDWLDYLAWTGDLPGGLEGKPSESRLRDLLPDSDESQPEPTTSTVQESDESQPEPTTSTVQENVKGVLNTGVLVRGNMLFAVGGIVGDNISGYLTCSLNKNGQEINLQRKSVQEKFRESWNTGDYQKWRYKVILWSDSNRELASGEGVIE